MYFLPLDDLGENTIVIITLTLHPQGLYTAIMNADEWVNDPELKLYLPKFPTLSFVELGWDRRGDDYVIKTSIMA